MNEQQAIDVRKVSVADNQWIDLFQARVGGALFGPAERDALLRAYIRSQTYGRGDEIVGDRDKRAPLHLVSRGWAGRIQRLEDGSVQITDFVLPGEFCDLSRITDGLSERAIALTPVRVALLNRRTMLEAIEDHPNLGLALLHLALSEQAILREWLVCLGRREKREHLAHLLCELHLRLRRVGLVADHEFDLPLTQEELADAMGISPQHTNRVLQRLRKDGVISLGQRHLTIHQPTQLRDIGEFDGSYLMAESPQSVEARAAATT